MVFALCLSPDEWLKYPQGQQLAKAPLVEIIKIGDSEPVPFRPAARPLKGLRVLSATHVVAGNVMSRTLAEQGVEVLHLVDPESFEHESLYIDACVGFQSSWLDLKLPEGRQRALELARGPTCLWRTFADAACRNWDFRLRNWPRVDRGSSMPQAAATHMTARGRTAAVLTWRPCVQAGSL